jgi:hypothetical protein
MSIDDIYLNNATGLWYKKKEEGLEEESKFNLQSNETISWGKNLNNNLKTTYFLLISDKNPNKLKKYKKINNKWSFIEETSGPGYVLKELDSTEQNITGLKYKKRNHLILIGGIFGIVLGICGIVYFNKSKNS